MVDLRDIKGIIFDYGGTIDSNGMHWAEVIWEGYENSHIPVSKADFRDAYVYGERTLAKTPLVLPHHNFLDMLLIKTKLQLDKLQEDNTFSGPVDINRATGDIAAYCYHYAKRCVEAAKPILGELAQLYPMVLVSNFYGNIESVLKDFGLENYFRSIVESAVVGVRKPDPAIFALGLKELDLPAGQVVVIGDSYDKDIIPATTLGCPTIWLKSTGWNPYKGNESATAIIADFREIKELCNL